MLSAKARRRLAAEHLDAPSRPLVAVLKCAAGIVTLFVVAAGPWLVLSAGGRGAATVRERTTAPSSAVAESRRVFEERRQRDSGPQQTAKKAELTN